MPVDVRTLRDGLDALGAARRAGVPLEEQLLALEAVVTRAIAARPAPAVDLPGQDDDLQYWLDYG